MIFSVSIDINCSEQMFAKETFQHLPSNFAQICVVLREERYTQSDSDPKLILDSGVSGTKQLTEYAKSGGQCLCDLWLTSCA